MKRLFFIVMVTHLKLFKLAVNTTNSFCMVLPVQVSSFFHIFHNNRSIQEIDH